jgi:hypothetical protein
MAESLRVRLGAALRRLVRRIQAGVMWVMLVALYAIGFAVTLALALVLDRRVIRRPRGDADSYWEEAEDYVADPQRAAHQS